MSNKTDQRQKKSLAELNDLFPLPNPSSADIEKTFEEMGKTIIGEQTETSKTPIKNPQKKSKS